MQDKAIGLYKNAEHERRTHYQYKEQYCERNSFFLNRYTALVKNLDGNSVETVNMILQRLKVLFECEDKVIDIFNDIEKEQLYKIQMDFKEKIFEIYSHIYCYKNYFLPKNYFDSNVYFYRYGCRFFQSIDRICSGNIIDAGAYIGDSSLLFAKMTKGTVYAWEAMNENCAYIKKTIQLNGLNNVEIINKAVGRKSSHAVINKNENLNWSTMLPYDNRNYDEQAELEMQSIDDFVTEKQVLISLIKLHIEGMESEAIRGAENTLKEQRPALLIHIHHTPTDFFEIKPYIESLDLGYKFKVYKPVNGSIFTGTMLLCEV